LPIWHLIYFKKTHFDKLNIKPSFEGFMYFIENGISQINEAVKVGWGGADAELLRHKKRR
jgi:hypothetical protein